MNQRQDALVSRLERINAFAGARPASDARTQRIERDLREVWGVLNQIRRSQRAATDDIKAHTRDGAALRRTLREGNLLPLRRDASVLLRGVPGVAQALEVPHKSAKGKELAASAARMAKALRPYASFLRKQGFAKDFLADLRLAALAVTRWEAAAPKVKQDRIRTTAELQKACQRAHMLILSLEGSAMQRGLREPSVWKLWLSARKTPRKPGRPRGSRNRPKP